MLILLGLLHLTATTHIAGLLDAMPPKARAFAVGPTVLNHVLVGVLLLPLGFSTWLAAAPRYLPESWAKRVLVANSLTVLALPGLTGLLTHEPQYYRAPLFVAGVALASLTAVLMALATVVSMGAQRPDDERIEISADRN
jgi:NO-binding membrane sensor protein with MHYT domain